MWRQEGSFSTGGWHRDTQYGDLEFDFEFSGCSVKMNQQDKIIHSMKTAKMSVGVNVRANEDQKLPEIWPG